MWQGSGLCVKDGSKISTTRRWEATADIRSCASCALALPHESSGDVVQIPKELFKKTWGIPETLDEPRRTAMYLVSFPSASLLETGSWRDDTSSVLARSSASYIVCVCAGSSTNKLCTAA